MELIATRPDGEAAVIAYGAYLTHGGARLRCPLLLIRHGQATREVDLADPATNTRYRVTLPAWPNDQRGHMRFEREELAITEVDE